MLDSGFVLKDLEAHCLKRPDAIVALAFPAPVEL